MYFCFLGVRGASAGDSFPTSLADLQAGEAVELLTAGRGGGGSLRFTQAGRWVFHLYGSGAYGDRTGQPYTGHVGVGYYFKDDVSINVEALGGHIDITDGPEDVAAFEGMDVLLRWHFAHHGDWTFYADVGSGFQQASEPFPAVGTHFNFRSQVGVGFTCNMHNHLQLMAGVRWLHISNANKKARSGTPGSMRR